jgi:hypothetical protein
VIFYLVLNKLFRKVPYRSREDVSTGRIYPAIDPKKMRRLVIACTIENSVIAASSSHLMFEGLNNFINILCFEKKEKKEKKNDRDQTNETNIMKSLTNRNQNI